MNRYANKDNSRTDDTEEEEEEDEEEEENFYDTRDRIASSSCSCSTSNSDSDPDPNPVGTRSGSPRNTDASHPKFANYDVWISQPASISERRQRLLHQMGLSSDPSLSRTKPDSFNRSSSSKRLNRSGSSTTMFQSKSDGASTAASDRNNDGEDGEDDDDDKHCSDEREDNRVSGVDAFASCRSSSSLLSVNSNDNNINIYNSNDNNWDCGDKGRSIGDTVVGSRNLSNGNSSCSSSQSPNKPPSGRQNGRRVDGGRSESNGNWGNVAEEFVEEVECNGVEEAAAEVCTIKNLDNGEEFVVKEIREDGMWNKLKEVGTGRQLTMEEFEMSVGHSPIVQELMRRQNVEDGAGENHDSIVSGLAGGGLSKSKKKGGWFRSIKSVASSVTGHKERRSSDEKDTGSEKGGRRSSSATDDSQDASFHGPERVRVKQYGKSFKELSAVYKSQEIHGHNGSIWSIKFSLDGKYLASAGEDCVIHVWQVVETERKGDLLMEKPEDGNLNLSLTSNGSPEPTTLSPLVDSHHEKRRRGRRSISRKSLSLDHILVPDTVFALSDRPICSFEGHLNHVLDLSWSKSQKLLSSSMDKTVRLWHLSSKTCLKIFSHSDYVTCIQFNPVDDQYFISGSLDAKVRIWSIPEHQVVDWNDLHEMVTAACYTPDGQGALVGSYKGSCRLYNTSENKLQQKCQINLLNRKKKAHLKKITGFQFAPGSSSEVLITSADSRIRVIDGTDFVHKFKGFRNTNSQISASLTSNGKYVVSASEDSYVYVWKHEADSRPSRNKGVTTTRSYEHFHCQDVSVAIPWPGMVDTWGLQETCSVEHNVIDNHLDQVSIANHPPTPADDASINGSSRSLSGCTNSPLNGIISSATNGYFFDRMSATWPEEKLTLAARTRRSLHMSVDMSGGVNRNMPAFGTVIVTASHKGEIRVFQNFGLPVRI